MNAIKRKIHELRQANEILNRLARAVTSTAMFAV